MTHPKSKIVVTNRVHDEVLARLRAEHEVVANASGTPWTQQELVARAAEADAIMAFMPDRIGADTIAACPRLKIVAGALKGYDNIDRAACTERGVWLTIVPDLLTVPTAELTVGLMIAVGRNMLAGDRHVRSGDFDGWRPHLYGTGLAQSVVGIVGMGAVGRAVARRLAGFETRTVYVDRRPLSAEDEAELSVRRATLDELLAGSDFVVVATHLMPETKHLIGPEALARMKPGSYLINPGRGSLVDEAAVEAAIRRGHLAGYAADVFEMEDWARADRPLAVAPGLLAQTDSTVLTPHIGSAVKRARFEIEMTAATNILEGLAGNRPPDAVNAPDGGAETRRA